jgi:hypothetical protein
MKQWAHWRGVASLVRDAVEHGSRAVERIQMENARRTFAVLESIPPVASGARLVHVAHDASVGAVHMAIRGVNYAVGVAVVAVLEEAEKHEARASD